MACDNVFGCLVCKPGYIKIRNTTDTDEMYYCMACPANCQTCITQTAQNGSLYTNCTECNFGYTGLITGDCFACGSTPLTFGCQICTPTMSCHVCKSGLVLNSTNQCSAESIDESNANGVFIALIVIFSIGIVLALIMIGYNIYTERSNRSSGLYNQI